jgi:hypothetical protein
MAGNVKAAVCSRVARVLVNRLLVTNAFQYKYYRVQVDILITLVLYFPSPLCLPACLPVCLSLSLSLSLYIYIYIYGPGVDSASNRNEYQEYFLGVKAASA